ncbi:MAG: DUF58 domain-containing protein [Candidatus Woesearchaeota archaeon]
MISTEFLKDLEKFSLIVRKKISSKYQGQRTSREPGRGITLREHRQYTSQDDIRTIDWKVYARTDDLFVRVYEEDKDLSVHLILDATKSMDYGNMISKYEYASMIGAGFLYLAMRSNERYKYTILGDDMEVHPMKRGRHHFGGYVNTINKRKPQGTMQLSDAIEAYRKILKSKSLVIIISDFLEDNERIDMMLRSLRKHDVRIIQVLDNDEIVLPFEGDYKFEDPESGTRMRTFIGQGPRAEYIRKLESHNNSIMQSCDTLGFEYYLANTSDPIFESFFNIINY